jgi:LPS export ABC transporter protein LptC
MIFYKNGFLLSLILVVFSCSNWDDASKKTNVIARPEVSVEGGFELELTEKKQKLWLLRGQKMARWKNDETSIKELYLDVYDSVGVLSSWLLSDSAWLGSKMNYIRLYGSVRLHTKDGLTVRTDSLWIDNKKKRAYTDSRVRVVSPDGDVLSGVGFESDTQFQDWKIVSNVKAIIQDVESRSKGVY